MDFTQHQQRRQRVPALVQDDGPVGGHVVVEVLPTLLGNELAAERGFADLARDYFSADPSQAASLEQQAAALFRLFEAPHYFRRAGKGRFKKAPAEIIQQALAAIEKKKQIQLQIDGWAQALAGGGFHPRAKPKRLLPLALAALERSQQLADDPDQVRRAAEGLLLRPPEGFLHGGERWQVLGLERDGGLRLQRPGAEITLQRSF